MIELKVSKYLPLERESLFGYFIEPALLERWAYPDGMNLKVPVMEPRENGKYRFEHRNQDGLYICNGYFKSVVPNEKLVQVDTVKNPEGFVIFKDLVSTTVFKQVGGGTEVSITQSGFDDENTMRECEKCWHQCLDKLEHLFFRNINTKRHSESRTL